MKPNRHRADSGSDDPSAPVMPCPSSQTLRQCAAHNVATPDNGKPPDSGKEVSVLWVEDQPAARELR